MPIETQCTECGKRYAVREDAEGKKVRCKACGTVFEAWSIDRQLAGTTGGAEEESGGLMDAVAAAAQDADRKAYHAVPAGPPPLPVSPPQFALLETPAPSLPRAAAAAPALPRQSPVIGYAAPGRVRSDAIPAGNDGASPLLILAYLVFSVIAAIIQVTQWSTVVDAFHARGYSDEQIPSTFSVIWLPSIVNVVLLLVVVAPLVMLGVVIGSKILSFRLPDGGYLRACGVAAVPGIMMGIIQLLSVGQTPNITLVILLLVCTVPVTWVVLWLVYGLTVPRSLLAFLFASILYTVGQVIAKLIVGLVLVGSMFGAAQGIASRSPAAPKANSSFPRQGGATCSPRQRRRSIRGRRKRSVNVGRPRLDWRHCRGSRRWPPVIY